MDEDRERPFRRGAQRGLDDPGRAGAGDAAGAPGGLLLRPCGRPPGRARVLRHSERRAALRRADARRQRSGRDRPSFRAQVGAHDGSRHPGARRGGARRARAVRPRRRGAARARRDRAGEVRQQPQRAARAIRPAARERHRPGLRAPPRRPQLDPRRPGRRRPRPPGRSARAREISLPVPGDDDLLRERRARAGADTRHRLAAGGAADRRDRARPRPRGAPRRLGPVRRRLHRPAGSSRAVAEPLRMGGLRPVGGAGACPDDGRDRRRVGPAQGCDERARPDPGPRRFSGRGRGRGTGACGGDDRRDRRAAATIPPPGGLPPGCNRGPARVDGDRDGQARLHPCTGSLPARARPPGRDRAPRRVPAVQAERLTRHVLRIADHPRPLARLDRGAGAHALRQPEVRADRARRRHARIRRERMRDAVPGDGLGRRAAGQQLRRDLLRPRGRAAAARGRRGRRAAVAQPPARRRPNAREPRDLAGGLHPLGSDPRPDAQPRRAARSTRS